MDQQNYGMDSMGVRVETSLPKWAVPFTCVVALVHALTLCEENGVSEEELVESWKHQRPWMYRKAVMDGLLEMPERSVKPLDESTKGMVDLSLEIELTDETFGPVRILKGEFEADGLAENVRFWLKVNPSLVDGFAAETIAEAVCKPVVGKHSSKAFVYEGEGCLMVQVNSWKYQDYLDEQVEAVRNGTFRDPRGDDKFLKVLVAMMGGF